MITGWVKGLPRLHSEKLNTEIRKKNNEEVNFGFTAQEAVTEASRCMRCYYISMVAI